MHTTEPPELIVHIEHHGEKTEVYLTGWNEVLSWAILNISACRQASTWAEASGLNGQDHDRCVFGALLKAWAYCDRLAEVLTMARPPYLIFPDGGVLSQPPNPWGVPCVPPVFPSVTPHIPVFPDHTITCQAPSHETNS